MLAAMDACKKIIQARNVTQGVEVSKIETFLEDLMKPQSNYRGMWIVDQEVALSLKLEIKFCIRRIHVDRK